MDTEHVELSLKNIEGALNEIKKDKSKELPILEEINDNLEFIKKHIEVENIDKKFSCEEIQYIGKDLSFIANIFRGAFALLIGYAVIVGGLNIYKIFFNK